MKLSHVSRAAVSFESGKKKAIQPRRPRVEAERRAYSKDLVNSSPSGVGVTRVLVDEPNLHADPHQYLRPLYLLADLHKVSRYIYRKHIQQLLQIHPLAVLRNLP